VLLLHRGHEHSGRLQHVVDELALDDFSMFAWDARGHGRSPGERGDSPSFAALVKDVDRFVRHVSDCYAIAANHIAVVGQSVGAVLAATWAHDYAPQLRCLVLTAPAFQVKLYVPLARPGLALDAAAGSATSSSPRM
jgi:alpha-beta hydrolase superfamily lysophospholipase